MRDSSSLATCLKVWHHTPAVADLSVLSKYETAHEMTILDPGEYNGLRELCSMHSDMELGPEEMFQFLK